MEVVVVVTQIFHKVFSCVLAWENVPFGTPWLEIYLIYEI